MIAVLNHFSEYDAVQPDRNLGRNKKRGMRVVDGHQLVSPAGHTHKHTHTRSGRERKGYCRGRKQEHLCLLEGWSKICGIYLAVSSGGALLLCFQVSESLLWILSSR